MKSGKQKTKRAPPQYTDYTPTRGSAVTQTYQPTSQQWQPPAPSFYVTDPLSLPPISRLRDGLYIGSFEAAVSQDV